MGVICQKLPTIAKGLAYADKWTKVFELAEQGIPQKKIAIQLGISDRTVRNYLKSGK